MNFFVRLASNGSYIPPYFLLLLTIWALWCRWTWHRTIVGITSCHVGWKYIINHKGDEQPLPLLFQDLFIKHYGSQFKVSFASSSIHKYIFFTPDYIQVYRPLLHYGTPYQSHLATNFNVKCGSEPKETTCWFRSYHVHVRYSRYVLAHFMALARCYSSQ